MQPNLPSNSDSDSPLSSSSSFMFMACLATNTIMYNYHQQNSDHPKPTFNPPIYSAMMTATGLLRFRVIGFHQCHDDHRQIGGGSVAGQKTTLRDELLAGEDDDATDVSFRPHKASGTRWKGFFELRKSHIGSKRVMGLDCDDE
ncbi:hypothetical protein R6Q59_010374 [Mikania micrantha]